ncbi:hypothetical protein HK101_009104 [Irineochytrium annulatum]|nr:hypothetical protein HK101_009104 [Irineochytrium annulatum]
MPVARLARAALVVVASLSATSALTTVNVMLMPVLTDSTIELDAMQNFTETHFTSKTGIVVNYQFTTTRVSTEYAGMVEAYLTTQDPSFDIFMIDVVWPGDLAPNLLDLTPYFTPADKALHNPQIWDSDVVNGRHVALPYFADYGIFYYRTDLLAKYNYSGPPETWDEMESMAKTILAGEGHPSNLAGYLAQFDLYEGLTCNVMEWLRSADAGSVVDMDGSVTFKNANTTSMMKRVQRWFNEGITPKYALTYQETDCLNAWIKGGAIFMRQWPYQMSVTESSKVKFTWDVAPLPGVTKESKGAATLGGWHLAPNQATRNASATAEVIKFMSSAMFQKERCLVAGVLPTIPSLFQDAEVCAKIRHCDLFSQLLVNPRPSAQTSPNYLAVSQVLFNAVRKYLSQQITVDAMLSNVQVNTLKAMGTYGTYGILFVDGVISLATYVSLLSPAGIALMVLSGLGILCSLASIVIVRLNLEQKIIKASSPDFLFCIIVGIMLGFSTTFVYIGQPTRTSCILQPWLLCLAFCLTNTALLSKTYRIFRIFGNVKKMSAGSLSSAALFRNMAIGCGVEVAVLVVWTVLDPPAPTGMFESSDVAFWTCSSAKHGDIFSGILLAMNGLMLVAGTWLAYQTRNVDEKFRESYYIALVMYNTFVWAIIAIALVFLTQLGGTVQFIIRSLVICMVSFGALILLFGPKFKDIFFKEKEVLRLPSSVVKGKVGGASSNSAKIGRSSTIERKDSTINGLNAGSRAFNAGASLPVYCRTGGSPIFLGSWMAGRCFMRDEGKFKCLVVMSEPQDRKCKGYCITLVEGKTQLIRTTADATTPNAGSTGSKMLEEYLVLLRFADQQFYEFEFENKEDLDEFVGSVVGTAM